MTKSAAVTQSGFAGAGRAHLRPAGGPEEFLAAGFTVQGLMTVCSGSP